MILNLYKVQTIIVHRTRNLKEQKMYEQFLSLPYTFHNFDFSSRNNLSSLLNFYVHFNKIKSLSSLLPHTMKFWYYCFNFLDVHCLWLFIPHSHMYDKKQHVWSIIQWVFLTENPSLISMTASSQDSLSLCWYSYSYTERIMKYSVKKDFNIFNSA